MHPERISANPYVLFITYRERTRVHDISYIKILVSYPKTSNDGLPTVFLEAWSNLVAILSSNIDPVPDIIDDKMDGYLVKPNTPEELAKGMYELLHNDQIRKKIIKNGWYKVKDYTWEKQIKKTNDLFIDII